MTKKYKWDREIRNRNKKDEILKKKRDDRIQTLWMTRWFKYWKRNWNRRNKGNTNKTRKTKK